MNVTSHDKRDFIDTVKLEVVGWGEYPGRPNAIPRFSLQGGRKVRIREGDPTMAAGDRVMQDHAPRNVGSL